MKVGSETAEPEIFSFTRNEFKYWIFDCQTNRPKLTEFGDRAFYQYQVLANQFGYSKLVLSNQRKVSY